MSKERISNGLKQTRKVSLYNRLDQNRQPKQVCLTDSTRIDNQSKVRDDNYYDWSNLEPLRYFYTYRRRKKYIPQTLKPTFLQEILTVGQLKYQNMQKNKEIDKKNTHPRR